MCAARCAAACPPGSAGPSCQFNRSTIYFDHDPYRHLTVRRLDLQGWTPGAGVYDAQCERMAARLIVEVGVWKGASATHLANCLKRAGSGVLFAVDTWTGALEFWTRRFTSGSADPERDLKFRNGMPTVYYSFLSNMVHQRVSDYVVPFPVPGRLAAALFAEKGMQADLVHIDAAHEYEDVVDDIRRWWPLVHPCGVLMGDDYSEWYTDDVVRAVDEWTAREGLTLEVEAPKWIVRKPGPGCKA